MSHDYDDLETYLSLEEIEKRFKLRIRKVKGGCWIWTGGKHFKTGYGIFYIGRGKSDYAHRMAYILWKGPIPPKFTIDHECHNRDKSCPGGPCIHRLCVNPAHLFARTNKENNQRGGRSASAKNAVKKKCPHGHRYTPENTRISRSSGGRVCKKCEVVQKQKRRQALYAQGLTAKGKPRLR